MLIILEKIGWGMLALTGFVGGIIGLALPVIPQVPFFLLALFALSKLSPRFHRWLTSRHWGRQRSLGSCFAWSFRYWKSSMPSAKPKSAY